MMVLHCAYADGRRELLVRHVRPAARAGFWFHDLPLGEAPGLELVWPGEEPESFPLEPWLHVQRRDVPRAPCEGEAYRAVLALDSALALDLLAEGDPPPCLDALCDGESADLLWRWLAVRRLGRQDLDALAGELSAAPAPLAWAPAPPACVDPRRGLALTAMQRARLAHAQWLRLFGPDADPWTEVRMAYALAASARLPAT